MKVTYLLVLALVAVFAASSLYGQDVFGRLGFSGNNLASHPEVLVTSIFLHGGLAHLLSNILMLLFVGLAVEGELGKTKMLAAFFMGSFAGDLVSLLIYPAGVVSIGASGGIFTLLGLGMIVRPTDLSVYPLVVPIPLAFLGIMYIFYNIYGFFTDTESNISYIAHFGGLLVGLAWGFAEKGAKRGMKIILISAAVMLLLAGALFLLASGVV